MLTKQDEDSSASASKRASEHLPKVVLVCGAVNSGKTSTMSHFVAELKQRGIHVCGVLSHGVWRAGMKVGIVVENIANGETRPLATVESGSSITQQGRYKFFDDGLYFGIKALLDAAEAHVVIVDEVGPLELREEGFAGAIRTLLYCATGCLIIVVRKTLADDVIEYFRIKVPKVVAVTGEQTEELLRSMVALRHSIPRAVVDHEQ
jgi:iron complex transport system ATP-binding protein